MHLIINALSVTNASGRHVLLGHLRQLAQALPSTHRFTILHHDSNADIVEELGDQVHWYRCPPGTEDWLRRSLWERRSMPGLVKGLGADALFTPAGISYAGISVPQIVFCQNPWCLVRDIHRGLPERVKALLQRSAYRKAVQRAELMVFNSNFMQDAYRDNAGYDPKESLVVYQGLNEEIFEKAGVMAETVERKRNQILTVSVMGAHKGLEIVCEALQLLKSRGIDFSWKVIGAWPDPSYLEEIQTLIRDLGLDDHVYIAGHVSLEELHVAYAESRVFCLMSLCESFGIPALEAQAFGTPSVTSQGCAMPEIDGDGGIYPVRGSVENTADALETLLTDDPLWEELSDKAKVNAGRFHWDQCSLPLVDVLETFPAR